MAPSSARSSVSRGTGPSASAARSAASSHSAADRTRSLSEADRQFYTAAYAQPGGMKAGFGYFKAFEQDAADFAGFARVKLQQPMLVLAGEKASGSFLIEQARLVDSQVEGVVIPGAGHWLMEEAPGQTVPRLVEFLNRR